MLFLEQEGSGPVLPVKWKANNDNIVTLFLNYLIKDGQEKGVLLLSHFILRAYMNTKKVALL